MMRKHYKIILFLIFFGGQAGEKTPQQTKPETKAKNPLGTYQSGPHGTYFFFCCTY